MANDVAALPDGFAVTKMMPRRPGLGTLVRLARGRATGEVLRWRAGGTKLEVVPHTEDSGPNGVEASADGRLLFVAVWGGKRLLRVPLDGGAPSALDLPHRPDNLTWAPDGRLLVTGQTGPFLGAFACRNLAAGTCAQPFSVLAVDPETLSSELVLAQEPARATGAGSVALRTADALWIGSYAGDRLLRVARP
jgi:sugar lactone lactonase YvrE